MTNQNTNEFDILNMLETEYSTQEITNTKIDIIGETKELFNQKILACLDLKSEVKQPKQKNKIVEAIIFFIKYILTTGTIFAVLLSVTNYSAYLQIVGNFLSPDSLKQSSQAMLASINSTNITKAQADDTNSGTTTNLNSLNDEKTFNSMTKLVKDGDDVDLDINVYPYENRIVIPKIGKNIPLVDVENRKVSNVKELEDVFMKELEDGVVRYPGSAVPGENGNTFIFGHSSNYPWIKGDYNDVFALLDNVGFGDEVIVYYNQHKYIYTIKEKHVVKPGDVSVLKRDNGKQEISLMTCWPVGTSVNRMLVIGELKEAD